MVDMALAAASTAHALITNTLPAQQITARLLYQKSALSSNGAIRCHVHKSSMLLLAQKSQIRQTGRGHGANGWEDGGMGGRSRWGNCSLSCPWAACSARCKLDGAARRYSLKT